MLQQPPLRYLPVVLKIAALFCLIVLSSTLCLYAASFILENYLGIQNAKDFLASTSEKAKNPDAALLAIAIISSLGFFLIPAVLYSLLEQGKVAHTLKADRIPPYKCMVAGLLIILGSIPLISPLVQINSMIPLPKFLEYLREAEAGQQALQNSFFHSTSAGHIILLSLAVALLPAIAEEFFFRGTIQRLLRSSGAGAVVSIVASALLFAIVHMSFSNFLALFFMGLMLGAIYELTDNLWVPIAGHFLNNMLTIIARALYSTGATAADPGQMESTPIYVSIAGLILVSGTLYWLMGNRVNVSGKFEKFGEK